MRDQERTRNRLAILAVSMIVVSFALSGAARAVGEDRVGSIVAKLLPVHRSYHLHCHRRRGYRHWCHQGERSWRRERDYDGARRWRRGMWRRRWRGRYRGRRHYDRGWRRRTPRPRSGRVLRRWPRPGNQLSI
jgi:hypothetical protein